MLQKVKIILEQVLMLQNHVFSQQNKTVLQFPDYQLSAMLNILSSSKTIDDRFFFGFHWLLLDISGKPDLSWLACTVWALSNSIF